MEARVRKERRQKGIIVRSIRKRRILEAGGGNKEIKDERIMGRMGERKKK